MYMPKLIPALVGAVALGAATSSAHAQAKTFEGAITMRVRELPSEIQAQVKGERVRMEMQGPMGAMVIIMDPATHETYMVMPAQQMVMVMKTDAMAHMADSMARAAGADPGSGTMTATGKKERVAGHECEIHRYRDAKSVFDFCVARGLGTIAAVGLFANPAGGMGLGGRGGAGGDAPGRGMEWRKLIGDGFALRMADSAGVAVWEITKVEPRTVDDSAFVVPADYRRMEMPFGRRPPQ